MLDFSETAELCACDVTFVNGCASAGFAAVFRLNNPMLMIETKQEDLKNAQQRSEEIRTNWNSLVEDNVKKIGLLEA